MKLSIITCTYNSEKYLQQTIDSVVSQKLDPNTFEHIFIDGNSTDKTSFIIKAYQNTYPEYNIQFLSKEPQGIYNAMNEGIKTASGEYVLFLHSDDYLEPKSLKEYIAYIEKTGNKDMYYAKFNAVDQNGTFIYNAPSRKIYQKGLKKRLFGLICYINQPTVLHKRTVHAKIGVFNETYKIAADTEFYIKLCEIHASSVFYNKTMTNFRIHEDGLSSSSAGGTVGPIERKKLLNQYYGIERYIYQAIGYIHAKLFLSTNK